MCKKLRWLQGAGMRSTHGSGRAFPPILQSTGRCWDPHTPLHGDTSAGKQLGRDMEQVRAWMGWVCVLKSWLTGHLLGFIPCG